MFPTTFARGITQRLPVVAARYFRLLSSTSDASTSEVSTEKKKPRRDLTNPVVRESVRRKKVAKGLIDPRAPVPDLCQQCGRRFCRCDASALERPRRPLDTDCCESDPQCKNCVFVVYEELVEEYERVASGKH